MTGEERPAPGQPSVLQFAPRAEGPAGPSQDGREPASAAEGERAAAGTAGADTHAVVADSHLRDLFREVERNSIHPVIIFGTAQSGKTLMLQSLIYEARTRLASLLSASLGASIFPPDYPESLRRYEKARDLINDGVRNFRDGILGGVTQAEEPFFVPVDLRVTRSAAVNENIRFAFLESVGEWLGYKKDGKRVFRELHPEIASILAQYSWPMSIIFVAPTIAGHNDKEFDDHCACLANAMENYDRLRSSKQGDNLLLLVSKWDALHSPESPMFSSATGSDVHDLVSKWYPIWSTYAHTIQGVRSSAKALMPYSAAWISDQRTVRRKGPHESAFSHFNKTLWNWLYANAQEASAFRVANGAVSGARAVLFPETLPESAAKFEMSWLGRIFTYQPWKR
jgi:hypothetical protein